MSFVHPRCRVKVFNLTFFSHEANEELEKKNKEIKTIY